MNEIEKAEIKSVMRDMQASGLCCSQIILSLALEQRGEDNETLIDAAAAFCGGLRTGKNCGALTGAAMLLAMADSRISALTVLELTHRFTERFGSVECVEIGGEHGERRMEVCMDVIAEAYFDALEILEEYGLEL